MKRKGKKALGSLIILLLILFCFCFRKAKSRSEIQLELQTFQVGGGWGYKVLMNKKVMIYQPIIPARDSLQPFPSEASARHIGNLVVERFKKKQNFSITTDDIHSCSD
ncbi:putative uncharacterized protein [Tannerella sp. CAG:118]|nr:putative uncharacterized protein [Tannerella sp. CAG:118]